MRYKKEVLKPQLETVEIICDRCGAKDSEYRKANQGEPLPMIKLEGGWGYNSKGKDLEFHTAWLCEECYEETLQTMGIKPLIKHYRPFATRRDQREWMYINLSNEQDNASIIDGPDGLRRHEKPDWDERVKEGKKEPVDKFRDWARKFLDDLIDSEYYSGPPPEGRDVRAYRRRIAEELRELFN